MTFYQELSSWVFPGRVEAASVPEVEAQAPSDPRVQFPSADRKPVIITFLRHCGCPFAEKTLILLRKTAHEHQDIRCIAVSHSDESATDKWANAVGGPGRIEMIVDHERKLYGAYGLGISSFWHVLNPRSMSNVLKLGREEGIWNKPTESGSRWQTAGTFGVSAQGVLKYAKVAEGADEIGDFEAALKTLVSP